MDTKICCDMRSRLKQCYGEAGRFNGDYDCDIYGVDGGDRKDLCARIINCKSKGRVHRMYHRAVSVDVNYSKLVTNKILSQYTDRHAHYVHMTQPK